MKHLIFAAGFICYLIHRILSKIEHGQRNMRNHHHLISVQPKYFQRNCLCFVAGAAPQNWWVLGKSNLMFQRVFFSVVCHCSHCLVTPSPCCGHQYGESLLRWRPVDRLRDYFHEQNVIYLYLESKMNE